MDIGEAINRMRTGRFVRRAGWNGKNMHLYIEDGLSRTFTGGVFKGQSRSYEPCIVMYTALGTHQPGWLASQQDLLSTDWEVVPLE